MSSIGFNTYKEISAFGIFSNDLLDKLKVYNIHTVSQLLGATKGFTNLEGLFDTEKELESLSEFSSITPEEIQSEYRDFNYHHSTGLINPNTDEDEK